MCAVAEQHRVEFLVRAFELEAPRVEPDHLSQEVLGVVQLQGKFELVVALDLQEHPHVSDVMRQPPHGRTL